MISPVTTCNQYSHVQQGTGKSQKNIDLTQIKIITEKGDVKSLLKKVI